MTKLKNEVTSLESKKTSRRKFFKAAAATGAVAAASLAMPNISVAQSAVTLKMQSAWGPADADPFFTMNKQYDQKDIQQKVQIVFTVFLEFIECSHRHTHIQCDDVYIL